MLADALGSGLSDRRMRIFFVESETLGQRGDMGWAYLAAASDRFGSGRYPVLSERRVGRWTEVMPLAQKVGRRSDVVEVGSDPGEPVGVGANVRVELRKNGKPFRDGLRTRAIQQDPFGRELGDQGPDVCQRLIGAQPGPIAVVDAQSQPYRLAGQLRRPSMRRVPDRRKTWSRG